MLQQSENLKWRICDQDYDLNAAVWLMGILNVTPDSFSDGGKWTAPAVAIDHAKYMVESGARIIDVGGESSRPGSEPVPEKIELQRILPVIREISKWKDVLVSVDTYKPRVAEAAIEAGASVVNDITGGRYDEKMYSLIAKHGVGYVMMHIQGMPDNMQINPSYSRVIDEIYAHFESGLANAVSAGIALEQIVIDPGIGFGKTLEHNLQILKRISDFYELGRPVMIGASRKSFIDKIVTTPVSKRLPGSLTAALAVIQRGVRILRIHDVAETRQAIAVLEAIEGA